VQAPPWARSLLVFQAGARRPRRSEADGVVAAEEVDHLAHPYLVGDPRLLKHDADPGAGCEIPRTATEEAYLSARRRPQTEHYGDRGRLASAVGPQQGDDLAPLDAEVEPGESARLSEVLYDSLHLDHRCHAASLPTLGSKISITTKRTDEGKIGQPNLRVGHTDPRPPVSLLQCVLSSYRRCSSHTSKISPERTSRRTPTTNTSCRPGSTSFSQALERELLELPTPGLAARMRAGFSAVR